MAARAPAADFRARDHRAEGHATGDAFSDTENIGFDPPMLGGKHFTRAPETRLNFIRNQQNAVAPAKILKHRQVFGWRHHIPALTLHRLKKQRSNFVGQNLVPEQSLFQVANACDSARAILEMTRTTMAKTEGYV